MDTSLCIIVYDIVLGHLYKMVKFFWYYGNWNGNWMNKWIKIDDIWYELYVICRHSVFKKENICTEK